MIFLHGFGEHTGLYHRYGFALNAAGVDLWAVDQFGHGLTPGTAVTSPRWRPASGLADRLAELAEADHPGIPACRTGTFVRRGGHAVAADLAARPLPRGGDLRCTTGTRPRTRRRELDLRDRPESAVGRSVLPRPMENDPLAFVDADGGPLARELDRAWDRFGADLPTLEVPTLAVHGSQRPDRRPSAGCGPTPSRSNRSRSSRSRAAATTSSTT